MFTCHLSGIIKYYTKIKLQHTVMLRIAVGTPHVNDKYNSGVRKKFCIHNQNFHSLCHQQQSNLRFIFHLFKAVFITPIIFVQTDFQN